MSPAMPTVSSSSCSSGWALHTSRRRSLVSGARSRASSMGSGRAPPMRPLKACEAASARPSARTSLSAAPITYWSRSRNWTAFSGVTSWFNESRWTVPGVAEERADDVRVHRDHAVDRVARRLRVQLAGDLADPREVGRQGEVAERGVADGAVAVGVVAEAPELLDELLVVGHRRGRRDDGGVEVLGAAEVAEHELAVGDGELGVAADEAAEGAALRRRGEQQEVRARAVGAEHLRGQIDGAAARSAAPGGARRRSRRSRRARTSPG